MDSDSQGDFITVARVVKTQGRQGEVAAEVHSDVPDRFVLGMKLLALDRSQAARRELEVEDLWPHKGLLVLKFSGVDSMNDAESLIGAELQIARAERAELAQGWNYVSDLVGCTVSDVSDGTSREIGKIEDVQFGAGEAPLLIVADAGKRFDVPFAEAYLEGVDVGRREVRMRLPEGMLEINAPMTFEEKQQARMEAGAHKKRR
ncbi:MAG TPA: ribosome maturation factor RimM [Verrucomicrobiae bacterium]|nr:ribosome maturation factor RimM [Verrucomicrobiae bacterium]